MNNLYKLYIPLSIFIILFCCIVSADYYCYQETPNVSTACGGLSNGTYWWDTAWTAARPTMSILYDGDWVTFETNGEDDWRYFYINYSKPANASNNSYWQVGHLELSGVPFDTVILNHSIPTACWNRNPLQFALSSANKSFSHAKSLNATCYDGTQWLNIFYPLDDANGIFEEAMLWEITTAPTSIPSAAYDPTELTTTEHLFYVVTLFSIGVGASMMFMDGATIWSMVLTMIGVVVAIVTIRGFL